MRRIGLPTAAHIGNGVLALAAVLWTLALAARIARAGDAIAAAVPGLN